MAEIPGRIATQFQVFSVLNYSDFRKFWFGSLGSVTGFQIFLLAQGWLIYDITGSKLYIGYIGLASGIPAICLNLFGGVIADKIDQRKLIIVTQVTSSLLMFVLATLTLLDMINVWHMMVVSFVLGCTQAFDGPTRQALFPHLIDHKDMVNAVALNAMVWQGTRVFGPALGGVIIGTRLGIAPGFYAAFVGFLVMALMIGTLKISPKRNAASRSFFADMLQGITFVWNNSTFLFLIGMTFFNSIFGMSYVFLLPVFAKDIFDAGTSGLGLLSASSGIGALCGTFLTASLSHYKGRGVLLLTGSVLFGISLILFATSGVLFNSLVIAFSNSAISSSGLSGILSTTARGI